MIVTCLPFSLFNYSLSWEHLIEWFKVEVEILFAHIEHLGISIAQPFLEETTDMLFYTAIGGN